MCDEGRYGLCQGLERGTTSLHFHTGTRTGDAVLAAATVSGTMQENGPRTRHTGRPVTGRGERVTKNENPGNETRTTLGHNENGLVLPGSG